MPQWLGTHLLAAFSLHYGNCKVGLVPFFFFFFRFVPFLSGGGGDVQDLSN